MATTSIRLTLVQAVITAASAHSNLAGVQIGVGWPGDVIERESIWTNQITGNVSIPVMQAGRKQRDDQFDVPWAFMVDGTGDYETTFARLLALMAAFEDVLANDPTLAGLDGLVSAQITNEDTQIVKTDTGHYGAGSQLLAVHSRLL